MLLSTLALSLTLLHAESPQQDCLNLLREHVTNWAGGTIGKDEFAEQLDGYDAAVVRVHVPFSGKDMAGLVTLQNFDFANRGSVAAPIEARYIDERGLSTMIEGSQAPLRRAVANISNSYPNARFEFLGMDVKPYVFDWRQPTKAVTIEMGVTERQASQVILAASGKPQVIFIRAQRAVAMVLPTTLFRGFDLDEMGDMGITYYQPRGTPAGRLLLNRHSMSLTALFQFGPVTLVTPKALSVIVAMKGKLIKPIRRVWYVTDGLEAAFNSCRGAGAECPITPSVTDQDRATLSNKWGNDSLKDILGQLAKISKTDLRTTGGLYKAFSGLAAKLTPARGERLLKSLKNLPRSDSDGQLLWQYLVDAKLKQTVVALHNLGLYWKVLISVLDPELGAKPLSEDVIDQGLKLVKNLK